MSFDPPFTTGIIKSMYRFSIAYYEVLLALTVVSAIAFAVLLYKTYKSSQYDRHDQEQRWEHLKLLAMLFTDGCVMSLLAIVTLGATVIPMVSAVY
jgi:hypothetical protein